MDPLDSLLFFLLFTEQNTLDERRKMTGVASLAACLVIYFVFYFGEWIRKVLDVGGIRVVTRIMGLLLAVIALTNKPISQHPLRYRPFVVKYHNFTACALRLK